jgi:hypothetical protein
MPKIKLGVKTQSLRNGRNGGSYEAKVMKSKIIK